MHTSGNINRRLTHAGFCKKDKPIISVDIETDGLGGPFVYGAYQRETDPTPTPFHSMAALWQAMIAHRNRGYIWYAHNGGEYDYRYLIPSIRAYQKLYTQTRVNLITQADRTIGISIRLSRKQTIELRDSYALLPNSLEKLAAALAPEYPKLDIGLKKDVKFDVNNPEHITYCHRDVTALLHVVRNARKLIREQYGVQVGWTTGATSMRAFRHQMREETETDPAEEYWRIKPETEQWIRQCYHGGIVALTYWTKQTRATCIDINSTYPSVMRNGVPYGTPMHTYSEVPGAPAFYLCRCYVPDHITIPFLPLSTDTGVLWPRGIFQSYITSDEMLFARERGCKCEVIEGYAFSELIHPFDAFVTKCETLRNQYKGTGLEVVVKLLQNALYGKLAMKDTARSYILCDDEIPEGYTPMIDENTGEHIDNIAFIDEKVDEPYQFIQWAAWITAQARLHLMRSVYAIGPDSVYYCDTDSITCDTDALARAIEKGTVSVGTKYGEWKIEHNYEWFWSGAPKFYAGLKQDGKYVVKCKGVPRSAIHIGDILDALENQLTIDDVIAALEGNKRVAQFVSMSSALAEQKRGVAKARAAHRALSSLENSQNWEKLPNGRVLPRKVQPAI